MTKLFRRTFSFFTLILVVIMLIGCGMLEEGDDKETTYDSFLDDPNYYLPGDSVRGGDFSFLDVKVKGFVWDSEQEDYVEIQGGDYLKPGKHRIAVQASSRRDPSILTTTYEGLSDLIEGAPMDQRVYLSDGGTTYLVEAYKDPKSGLYICDINIDGTYPVYPLLIEIVYRDGMAKKRKILVSTRENLRAPSNELVKEGLILGISTDFVWNAALPWVVKKPEVFNSVLGLVNYVYCDAVLIKTVNGIGNWGLTVDFLTQNLIPFLLSITDIRPGTPVDNAVGVGYVKFLNKLIELQVGLEDEFEDGDVLEGGIALSVGASTAGDLGLMLPRITQLLGNLLVAAYSEPISLNLDSLLTPIADDFFDVVLGVANIQIDYINELVEEVFNHILPTNLTVFGNAFGRPEENTEDLFMLYLSGFLADSRKLPSKDELALVGRCLPEWPGNTIMNDSVQVDLSPIKNEGFDVGVAVSGYMLNSLMGQVGEIFEINAESSVVNLLFVLISHLKQDSSSELTGKLQFNPNGFTFDFRESEGTVEFTLLLQDLLFTIMDNGAPVTVISMDIVLDMTLALRWENDNWIADIGLNVVPERSNIHLLEDKIGLTFLDHSSFLKAIVDVVLTGKARETNEKIHWEANFTEILGVLPEQEGTTLSSKDGHVYLTLNFNDEDLVNWEILGKWLNTAFGI